MDDESFDEKIIIEEELQEPRTSTSEEPLGTSIDLSNEYNNKQDFTGTGEEEPKAFDMFESIKKKVQDIVGKKHKTNPDPMESPVKFILYNKVQKSKLEWQIQTCRFQREHLIC